MLRFKDSKFYREAFQELNYPFGDFYLLENFVVAEIKENIVFNWKDHAKILVEDLSTLYDQNGREIIYISNRINNYSVVPSDWLSFFKYSYSLKGYYIVNQNGRSFRSIFFEKLFFRGKIQMFENLNIAIMLAKRDCISRENLLKIV